MATADHCFVLAACQMTSTNDKAHNLRATTALVEQASLGGARLCCLPECSSFMGSPSAKKGATAAAMFMDDKGNPTRVVDAAEGLDGPYVHSLQQLAKRCAVWLSVGGFPEAVAPSPSDTKKVYNTHFLISPDGDVVSPSYRKIHLFDNPLTGLVESRTTEAGSDVCVVDAPGLARIGLTVCYDVRFPELYSALCRRPSSSDGSTAGGRDARHGLGAEIVLVPSAFTVPTGQAHWLTLLRARAIENQCYVVAAAQVGRHNDKRESWGESVIIDPWGSVLAKAPTIHELASQPDVACTFLKEDVPAGAARGTEKTPPAATSVVHTEHGTVLFATFDRAVLMKTRTNMPVESHRRPDLYYPSPKL